MLPGYGRSIFFDKARAEAHHLVDPTGTPGEIRLSPLLKLIGT